MHERHQKASTASSSAARRNACAKHGRQPPGLFSIFRPSDITSGSCRTRVRAGTKQSRVLPVSSSIRPEGGPGKAHRGSGPEVFPLRAGWAFMNPIVRGRQRQILLRPRHHKAIVTPDPCFLCVVVRGFQRRELERAEPVVGRPIVSADRAARDAHKSRVHRTTLSSHTLWRTTQCCVRGHTAPWRGNHLAPLQAASSQGENDEMNATLLTICRGGRRSRMSAPTNVMLSRRTSPGLCWISTQ
jgi:hypothetical protein